MTVNEFTEFVRSDLIAAAIAINWSGSGPVLYNIKFRLLRGADVIWPPSGGSYLILATDRTTGLSQYNPFT